MNLIEHADLPKIAIIGRPNVGKSSIFNRILRRRKAIIESSSGVTRDRLYARITLNGKGLVLIDTGGIISKPKDKIAQLVYRQCSEAIAESDAVIFVCDLLAGVRYQDEQIGSLLRRSKKKTFLVVNKVDKDEYDSDIFEFFQLGLGRPYALSALCNRGLDRLSQEIGEYISGLKKRPPGKEVLSHATRIAVVGRPNVGKSSLINCIANQERVVVDEAPGTTRDSIDVHIRRGKEVLIIIDTAGIKHKRKIKETVEVFSLARSKQSIRRCDVALVMIDIRAGLYRDDIDVIDYVIKQGRPCVLLVNKRDLAKTLDTNDYIKALYRRFRPLEWIPVLFTSCKERKNIIKAVDTACAIAKRAELAIETSRINELLVKLQGLKAHPSIGKIRPKILYATQIATQPVKFLLFVSNPTQIKREYLRFIEHRFRREFALKGIPIFFELRTKRG